MSPSQEPIEPVQLSLPPVLVMILGPSLTEILLWNK